MLAIIVQLLGDDLLLVGRQSFGFQGFVYFVSVVFHGLFFLLIYIDLLSRIDVRGLVHVRGSSNLRNTRPILE
jgi:hypothetical protein